MLHSQPYFADVFSRAHLFCDGLPDRTSGLGDEHTHRRANSHRRLHVNEGAMVRVGTGAYARNYQSPAAAGCTSVLGIGIAHTGTYVRPYLARYLLLNLVRARYEFVF